MKSSPEPTDEPMGQPKKVTGRDWGKLGLTAAGVSLIGIVFGILALVLTGGFAVFLGLILGIPMIIIPLIASPIGIVMGLAGVRTASSSKKSATVAIVLNSLVVVGLLTFGQPLFSLLVPLPRAADNYQYGLRFSPDGNLLATGWTDGIRLLDARTGKFIRVFEGHTAQVDFVAYSPDGRMLASAARDQTVRLWDTNSGESLHTFAWDGPVQALSFAPDGGTLMVATRDRGITLLNTATFAEMETVAQQGRLILFSSDGRYAGISNSNGFEIVNTSDFDQPITIPSSSLDQFAFSSDLEFAAVSRQDVAQDKPGEVKIWNLANNEIVYSEPLEYSSSDALSGYSVTLAFSPDGKRLAYTAGEYFDLVDVATQKTVSFEAINATRRFPVSTILFAPDGSQIVTSITDQIMLWDAASGQLLWTYMP